MITRALTFATAAHAAASAVAEALTVLSKMDAPTFIAAAIKCRSAADFLTCFGIPVAKGRRTLYRLMVAEGLSLDASE